MKTINKKSDATLEKGKSNKPLDKKGDGSIKTNASSTPVDHDNAGKTNKHGKPWRGDKDKRGRGTEYTDVPTCNDIDWYRKAETYTDTSVQFNFNVPFGSQLPTMTDGPSGIMRHLYAPLLGEGSGTVSVFENDTSLVTPGNEGRFYSFATSSPFYIAAVNMYSYVRYSNSGARNYYVPDMAMMLASAISIYSIFPLIWKVLSAAKHFEFANRYMGRALVNAIGFDYKDIITNYNSYVTQVNALAVQCNTIRVPKGMSVLERWSWLNGNIFADNDLKNVKQQYHIMYPMYIWEYEEYTEGGKLKAIDIRPQAEETVSNYSAYQTLQVLIDKLQSAISALRSSESFGIMMGDILKAYTESGLYSVPTITDDISFQPLYSPEFVIQIQNRESIAIKVYNGANNMDLSYNSANPIASRSKEGWGRWLLLDESFDVFQDVRENANNNGVIWQGKRNKPSTNLMYPGLPLKLSVADTKALPFIQKMIGTHALNMYTDEIKGDILIYATRFMFTSALYDGYTAGSQTVQAVRCILSSGTEIIIESAAFTLNRSGTTFSPSAIMGVPLADAILPSTYLIDSNAASYSDMLFTASQWVTSPRLKLQIFYNFDDASLGMSYNTFGDVINPAYLTNADLSKINAPCLYSEWVVPGSDGIKGINAKRR